MKGLKFKIPTQLTPRQYSGEGDMSYTAARMVCATCGFVWTQAELGTGFGSITSDCPVCHGKAQRGSNLVYGWAPSKCPMVWSETRLGEKRAG